MPAYEVIAKQAALEATQLRQMISTLTELHNQPENEPFSIAVPEITPISL